MDIVQYYKDLLILQYRGKPKAEGVIEVMVKLILQDDILIKMIEAFNPETAVGKQLDILGKWVGVDRFYLGDGTTQSLNDDDYRIVLNFRVAVNNTDMTHKGIDDLLFEYFGNDVVCSTDNNLTIFYFINSPEFEIGQILFNKKVLPKPLAIRLGGIIKNDIFFGFCNSSSFNDPIPSNVSGFANSTNFLTKEGRFLKSSDIIIL